MANLLSIARVADILTKEAATVPTTQLGGEDPLKLDKHPHGEEAHTRRQLAVGGPRVRKTEGPRAYAPRLQD